MKPINDNVKYLMIFCLMLVTALAIVIGFISLVADAHAEVVINDGSLKALYHFDGNADDSSGNGYNLTANGSALNTGDPYLGTYSGNVSSSGGYWDIANNLGITGNSTVSIGWWMKLHALPPQQGAQRFQTSGSNNGQDAEWALYWEDHIGDSGTMDLTFSYGAGKSTEVAYTDAATSTWHWYLMTYDRDTQRLNQYLDNEFLGTSVGTKASSSNIIDILTINSYLSTANSIGSFDEFFITNNVISTSTRNALWNNGNGDVISLTQTPSSTASVNILSPNSGSYLNPFNTTVFVRVSSTEQGVLKIYYQNNASTTVKTFAGNVSGGTYFDARSFDTNLWAIWATFKISGYETSTSPIRQFDVGSAGDFSTTTPVISQTVRDSICAGVGNATSASPWFWSSAATDFSNGIAHGGCELLVYLFVPGQVSVPQLDLQYRVPFNQIYALYDIMQSIIAQPTSTQTFGIIIPTLPRPATTTIFSFNTTEIKTGMGAEVFEAAAPYVTMMLYLILALYGIWWAWIITILLD